MILQSLAISAACAIVVFAWPISIEVRDALYMRRYARLRRCA